jgi:hypothetical protein
VGDDREDPALDRGQAEPAADTLDDLPPVPGVPADRFWLVDLIVGLLDLFPGR